MIFYHIEESLTSIQSPHLSDPALLKRTALQTLYHAHTGTDVDVSIVITDDDRIQELNQQFRNINASTDVLAFPAGEIDPDSGELYLGDVIISHPHAAAQAAAGGHTLDAELQLLVVHGLLHLLGYNHDDEEGKSAMWDIQAEILTHLGCPVTSPADKQI